MPPIRDKATEFMSPFDHPDGFAIDADRLHDWTEAIVRRVGAPPDIAIDVADVLVASDLRGIPSHGTGRLPVYVSLVEGGVMDASARPEKIRSTPAVALWDGRNGWGHHAGRVLMDEAIATATVQGIAVSSVRHANHYGIAGWYAMRAAARGFIGLSMTNTSPLVAPTRGRTRLLGTNPIALAAPAGRFGMLVLDMATSTITWGRLLVAARRGTQLPQGVAIDAEGQPTTSPAEALAGGALLPLGGAEETAGYKGYGLALLVDVLTGVLAAANFGSRVVPFSLTDGPSDLGQLFMAIDPASVEDGFEGRLEILLEELVNAPLAPGTGGAVMVPGQPEAQREAEQRRSGIVLDHAHHESLIRLGTHIGVAFPTIQPSAPSEQTPARPGAGGDPQISK